MRRNLINLRWPIVALLLAQVFAQVLVTAHASEHAFHAHNSYCEALDHADHQQGDGIDAVPATITLLETDCQEGFPDVKSIFVPRQYSFNQRAPPAYLY